ncbi:MAG: hypothetical protein AAFO69_15105 [Bacteroidota bacterium]
MRKYLFIAVFCAGCWSCETRERPANESIAKKEESPAITMETLTLSESPDSAVTITAEETTKPAKVEAIEKQPDFYLNQVRYFKATNEFYVSLVFNQGVGFESLKVIEAQLDTVVFEDDAEKRTLVPMAVASKYFDLSLLDELTIFDSSLTQIQRSELKRVESLQGQLSDEYIAVFNSDQSQNSQNFFGIGGDVQLRSDIKAKYTKQPALIANIEQKLSLSPEDQRASSVVEINGTDTQLVLLSYFQFGKGASSYIIEAEKDHAEKLLETTDEFVIDELLVTPIFHNGKPVLLLYLSVPETDITWNSPAVFEGDQYQIVNNPRIFLDAYDMVPCNSFIVARTSNKLDSLQDEDIALFLRTFSASCRNNVEFSEMSNEVLFEIIDKHTYKLVELLNQKDMRNLQTILSEIRDPINDRYTPKELIEKVEALKPATPMADSVSQALRAIL